MLRFLRSSLFRRVTPNLEALGSISSSSSSSSFHSSIHSPKPNSTGPPASASAAPSADPSLTLHFLQTSCGLSHGAASAASEKVQLKTTDNADEVIDLLRDYGFSTPHIAALVSRRPSLLLASPGGTLKPKLEFYRSEAGLTDANLAKAVSSSPVLLLRSVEKRLAPNLAFLKSIVSDEQKLFILFKSWARILAENLPGIIRPRMEALRSYGATDSVISKLLTTHPMTFTHLHFDDAFERVKRLPISPSSHMFAHALGVLGSLPKGTWERKVANFVRLGWSEDQVLRAFVRHPYCMSASDDKISRKMRFFAEKLGWEVGYLSMYPVPLSLSFEKRILPRCLVLEILASKGLFAGKVKPRHLMMGEKLFLAKYVIKYKDQLSELLKATGDNRIKHYGLDIKKLGSHEAHGNNLTGSLYLKL